jgi:hydrogenase maturation factor
VTEMEIEINLKQVPIAPIAAKICDFFAIDPYTSISSGALLLTVASEDAQSICSLLRKKGILCTPIGKINKGQPNVVASDDERRILDRPSRDGIAILFDA